jgi:hypothetical protein
MANDDQSTMVCYLQQGNFPGAELSSPANTLKKEK